MKSFGPCSCVIVWNVRKSKLWLVQLLSIKSCGVTASCMNLLGVGKGMHSWNLIAAAFLAIDDLYPCNKPSSVLLDINTPSVPKQVSQLCINFSTKLCYNWDTYFGTKEVHYICIICFVHLDWFEFGNSLVALGMGIWKLLLSSLWLPWQTDMHNFLRHHGIIVEILQGVFSVNCLSRRISLL